MKKVLSEQVKLVVRRSIGHPHGARKKCCQQFLLLHANNSLLLIAVARSTTNVGHHMLQAAMWGRSWQELFECLDSPTGSIDPIVCDPAHPILVCRATKKFAHIVWCEAPLIGRQKAFESTSNRNRFFPKIDRFFHHFEYHLVQKIHSSPRQIKVL